MYCMLQKFQALLCAQYYAGAREEGWSYWGWKSFGCRDRERGGWILHKVRDNRRIPLIMLSKYKCTKYDSAYLQALFTELQDYCVLLAELPKTWLEEACAAVQQRNCYWWRWLRGVYILKTSQQGNIKVCYLKATIFKI